MLYLETERLSLYPLTVRQMSLWMEGYPYLEREMGLAASGNKVDDITEGVIQRRLSILRRNMAQWKLNTIWLMVLREKRRVVGYIVLKGRNHLGEVFMECRTETPYRNQGIMTEALQHLGQWIHEQKGITAMVAEAEQRNIPYQRVLQKVGMKRERAGRGIALWKQSPGMQPSDDTGAERRQGELCHFKALQAEGDPDNGTAE